MIGIILCGSQNDRMARILKSLIRINGRTILERQLNSLPKLDSIVLSTGIFGNELIGYCQTLSHKVKIFAETGPLGSGGAVKYAMSRTKEELALVVYGDVLFDKIDFNYNEYSQGLIMTYQKENAGIYVLPKSSVDLIETTKFSIEKDLLPKLLDIDKQEISCNCLRVKNNEDIKKATLMFR